MKIPDMNFIDLSSSMIDLKVNFGNIGEIAIFSKMTEESIPHIFKMTVIIQQFQENNLTINSYKELIKQPIFPYRGHLVNMVEGLIIKDEDLIINPYSIGSFTNLFKGVNYNLDMTKFGQGYPIPSYTHKFSQQLYPMQDAETLDIYYAINQALSGNLSDVQFMDLSDISGFGKWYTPRLSNFRAIIKTQAGKFIPCEIYTTLVNNIQVFDFILNTRKRNLLKDAKYSKKYDKLNQNFYISTFFHFWAVCDSYVEAAEMVTSIGREGDIIYSKLPIIKQQFP